MSNWAVVDFRNGDLSAGLFSDDWPDMKWSPIELRYDPNPMVGQSTNDAVEWIQKLAFCQENGSSTWVFTDQQSISNLSPDFKSINSITELFNQYGEKALWSVFQSVLNPVRKQFSKTAWIFLFDDIGVTISAEKFIQNLIERQNSKSIPVPEDCRSAYLPGNEYYLGFSCIDPQNSIPPDRSLYCCQLASEKGNESIYFRWFNNAFIEEAEPHGTPLNTVNFEKGDMYYEKKGAVLFALYWQDRLQDSIAEQLEVLKKQVGEKEDLLRRMSNILSRISMQPATL